MIAIMSADQVAERTLFRNNIQPFVYLYMSGWNIVSAFLITYFVLRRFALQHQKVLDEVGERTEIEKSLRILQHTLEQIVLDRTNELTQRNQELAEEIMLRRRAEQTRTELLQQLMRVQEEERRHIARELHDQMGQYLTGLNIGLELLKDSTLRASAVLPLQELVKQIGCEVHDLSLRLRPPSLDDMGLHATLVNYVQEWSERSRVKADFQSVGLDVKRLPTHLETTVFRIVQEALTNVLKHAAATQVSLCVRCDKHEVVAVVEDDGSGFDPDDVLNVPPIDQRLGLLGIKERAALVGGRFTVESRRGAGTTLLIRLPVPFQKETHAHG